MTNQVYFYDQHTLAHDFFEQPTVRVAQSLLGQYLHYKGIVGIITETEAYCGFDDPASHAYRGRTPRNEVMFGPAGYSYVYLIYGMYHCLNIVTEGVDFPAAVLIRGLFLRDEKIHLDGPGKLCRYLNITRQENNQNLINNPHFYLTRHITEVEFQATPRIGIKQGREKLWRFVSKSFN